MSECRVCPVQLVCSIDKVAILAGSAACDKLNKRKAVNGEVVVLQLGTCMESMNSHTYTRTHQPAERRTGKKVKAMLSPASKPISMVTHSREEIKRS